MKQSLLLLLLLLCLSSCNTPSLSVQTEYWDRRDLASIPVDTPDPDKESGLFGQHIYISWFLPSRMQPAELKIAVRLKNGELYTKTIPITQTRGLYCFPVVGEDFTKKGGVLSYFCELVFNGEVVATSRHKFWVEQLKTMNH